MTVENTTTIDGLDITLPRDSDFRNEGDNHLRQFKIVEKTIFGGTGGDGFNAPILATEGDLNNLQGLIEDIEIQLQDLRNGETPIGGIQSYIGLLSNIPARFFLCNGANGTPNLSDQFVLGTATEGSLGITGGSADDVVVSHTHNADHSHTGSSDTLGNHFHTMPPYGNDVGSFISIVALPRQTITQIPIFPAGDHAHAAVMPVKTVSTAQSGVSPAGTNIPQYYKAAYIMRTS